MRCLAGAEEWLLWREAAELAAEGSGVLQPAGLAEALRRADALVRDWGMAWPGTPSAEASMLVQARRTFARRCRELGAYAAGDWTLILRAAKPTVAPLLFAGFSNPGTVLEQRLRELGAIFGPQDAPGSTAGSVEVCAGADGTDELRRAALWCRERLQHSPAARLLVVVPQLAQRRALAVQAFEHVLHGTELLRGPVEPLFAIEGGQSLADYPMIDAALGLLGLSGGTLEFAELASLLRCSYLACGSAAQRAALELLLRERDVLAASLAELCQLARSARGGALARLADELAAISPALVPPAVHDRPGGWARRFAAVLEAAGWPGPWALGSEEQQQRERFRALLGELALLGAAPLAHGAAMELLRAMAQRTAFEPASGDVPVTLTAACDDPLVGYDGIWVAGLSAEHWPAPPRPDSFVPIAAQRAVGYAPASAAGQLGLARQAMAAWRRSAPQWVLSWARSDGDVKLQPSVLLEVRGDPADAGVVADGRLADPLLAALRAGAQREGRAADQAGAWPAGRRLPGGTRALQLQSWCPFRAAAELRLGAAPVAEPAPGLDQLERGVLLHRALELTWARLRDSRALRALAAAGPSLQELARAVSARALRERLAARARPLATALQQNEIERLARLVEMLLRDELQRAAVADFAVLQLEQEQERELAGQSVRVRMDRVDRLEDGRVVVIDYKGGTARSFQALDHRPHQPQLLAYAQLAAGELAGVAAVYLNADEIGWRGAAAEAAVLPGLGRTAIPPLPWPQLLAHWRGVIEALVRGFAAGAAAVDPLPGVCATCHLPALCRVDPARQAEAEPEAPDANEVAGGA